MDFPIRNNINVVDRYFVRKISCHPSIVSLEKYISSIKKEFNENIFEISELNKYSEIIENRISQILKELGLDNTTENSKAIWKACEHVTVLNYYYGQ